MTGSGRQTIITRPKGGLDPGDLIQSHPLDRAAARPAKETTRISYMKQEKVTQVIVTQLIRMKLI